MSGTISRSRFAAAAGCAMALSLTAGLAKAQSPAPDADTDVAAEEGPDLTRLDVERLPPEAIDVERDQYASGWLVEGWLGGRGFLGGLGDLSRGGPYANIGVGHEWWHWFSVRLALEASFHETVGPGPPSPTAFELLGALLEARAQLNFSSNFAIFVQGEVGAMLALGDVLRAYGLDQSGQVGLQFGGSLGVDWHFENRHTSIGLLGGVRLLPSLADATESLALGVHGALYIRNVL